LNWILIQLNSIQQLDLKNLKIGIQIDGKDIENLHVNMMLEKEILKRNNL